MKVSAKQMSKLLCKVLILWGANAQMPPTDCTPSLFDTVVTSLNCFMLSATARMNWAWLMIGPLLSRNCTSWNDIASCASWAKMECSPGEAIRLFLEIIIIKNFIFILWKFLQMSKLLFNVFKISGGKCPPPHGCAPGVYQFDKLPCDMLWLRFCILFFD